jgi:hypothetical protein
MHTTRWQIAARQTQDELLAWDELDFTFLKVQNFWIILMLTTIFFTNYQPTSKSIKAKNT